MLKSDKPCLHKNTVILKSWRSNKRYGRFFAYGVPKKCTEVCANPDCRKKLAVWKPYRW